LTPPAPGSARSRTGHAARPTTPDVHKHPAYTRQRVRRTLERLRGQLKSDAVGPTALGHHGPVGRGAQGRAWELSYSAIETGHLLGPAWSTHWFKLHFELPADWAGREVRLDWLSHCEATLWRPAADGGALEPIQGLNPLQTEAKLTDAAEAGQNLTLYVEAACNDLLGNGSVPGHDAPLTDVEGVVARPRTPFFLERCRLFAVNPTLESIAHDLSVLSQLEADRTPPQTTAGVGANRELVRPALDPTWAGRLLLRLNEFCNRFHLDDRSTWEPARALLQGLLASSNPPVCHEMTAIGHNHIDTAWLWPLEETHRKTLRSWTAQLRLMETYPAYRFACSQAYQYAELEKSHPDVMRQIKARAQEGQWQPVGGTWIEPDCNLPSGESMVRQFLYGQQYFEQTFGRRCRELWNPDVFGYHAQLPQILVHCGIDRFLTQKLSWNNFTSPAHHTFFWRGLDGSEVLTHFPPADTYSGKATVSELRYHAANYKDADRSDQGLYLFGHGDGGGGATPEMVETLHRTRDLLGVPRTEFRGVDEFFDRLIDRSTHVPTIVGEMYFELHRGTFTSQAQLKRLNRQCEIALFEAEYLLAARRLRGAEVSPRDRERLTAAWKDLLLNQFHDILTGSCIHEVARRAEQDLEAVLATARQVRDQPWAGGDGGPTVLLNPAPIARRDVVPDASDAWQMVEAGPWAEATPTPSRDRVEAKPLEDGGIALQNAALSVRIGPGGEVDSLVDRGTGREALRSPAGLRRYHDRPNLWDAWDIDPFAFENEDPLPPAESVRLITDDPLRAEVEVVRDLGDGDRVRQVLRLDAEGTALHLDHVVDWSQRHRLLRFELPTQVVSDFATFESPYGVTRRPTHANTQADVAMYEVPGQRFVDLSDHGFGVSLLADTKYGYSARNHVIGVSLLRGPIYPDPICDQGEHRFSLCLHPHAGPWHDGDALERAERLTRPLLPLPAQTAAQVEGLLEVDGGVTLSAVKLAEQDDDTVVVRFYEPRGRSTEASIRIDAAVVGVERSNGLEDPGPAVHADESGRVTVSVRAFEVVTLLFRLS
jgi:alpha-mannosidase